MTGRARAQASGPRVQPEPWGLGPRPFAAVKRLQPGSITRSFAAVLVAAAGLSAAADTGAVTWREAPALLALFTPAAQRQAYRADTTTADLDAVVKSLENDASLVRTSGAWAPRSQNALDAFGKSGAYDRWTLARLYGSRQARVARGARLLDGRAVEAWTLISPYPSSDLARLEPGTLLLVLRIGS